ncbi:MAG TPA: TonB-dependent receptor, partial [Ohtaekwangia sp.]|nr:TonB-dependent receptor [Ohtaekwangia sp.]
VNASWNALLIESGLWNLNSSLSVFYNSIENLIQYGNRLDGSVTYINIDHFKSKGITFSHTLRRKNTTVKVGFAYTGRYNKFSEEDKGLPEFTWSPELNGSFTHIFTKPKLTVSLFYKYTGKNPEYVLPKPGEPIVLSETSGFHWADLTIQKTIMKNLYVTTGIRNLFDATRSNISGTEAGSAHGGSGDAKAIGYGRSYFMSIQFLFNR